MTIGSDEMPVSGNVCVWEPDPACLEGKWETYTEEQQARALMLATSSLQMLTYNRVGTCPITIRPCPTGNPCDCFTRDYEDPYAFDTGSPYTLIARPWQPTLRDGRWYNTNCGCGHSCAPLSEVDLDGPVGYIDTLLIDGVPQDLQNGDWRLDNGHLLVWQGEGTSPIPSHQDLNKPDSAVGTWSITYSQSYPVGADAKLAVAFLALEFAEACKPKGKCSLPQGVTNVVRNGVSFSIAAGLFPGGLTNIQMVDAFILKWAPAGAPVRPAAVFNPRDFHRKPRRTSSVPSRP